MNGCILTSDANSSAGIQLWTEEALQNGLFIMVGDWKSILKSMIM